MVYATPINVVLGGTRLGEAFLAKICDRITDKTIRPASNLVNNVLGTFHGSQSVPHGMPELMDTAFLRNVLLQPSAISKGEAGSRDEDEGRSSTISVFASPIASDSLMPVSLIRAVIQRMSSSSFTLSD